MNSDTQSHKVVTMTILKLQFMSHKLGFHCIWSSVDLLWQNSYWSSEILFIHKLYDLCQKKKKEYNFVRFTWSRFLRNYCIHSHLKFYKYKQ